MRALKMLGHPYDEDEINTAAERLEDKTEMDALIAYMQVLGTSFTQADKP
jgi:cytochrome c oxidase cbb3-type subunit II